MVVRWVERGVFGVEKLCSRKQTDMGIVASRRMNPAEKGSEQTRRLLAICQTKQKGNVHIPNHSL